MPFLGAVSPGPNRIDENGPEALVAAAAPKQLARFGSELLQE
jgi:hypothetical protein